MPLPSMYQDHQHTITRYVSQPCTKACTKPSTCTIPSINHVPQPVPQQVHQPCTNTCTKPCINHAPTPVPNHASTMHQHLYASTMHHNLYHMPQPSTMYINTIPSTNHVPYHVHQHVHQHLYHTMYQQCISTIYHITQSCHTPCTIGYIKQVPSMVYLNKVPNNQDHIPSICLNHAPNMCLKHVPMPQQYTKDLPQACTITSSTCNPQNMHINIPVTL
jgi:hypothetical protein